MADLLGGQIPDIVGGAQDLYHSNVLKFQQAANNIRILSEAKKRFAQENELFGIKKKQAQLDLKAAEMSGETSMYELEERKASMKANEMMMNDILRGQRAQIMQNEQQAVGEVKESVAVADRTAKFLDAYGAQQPNANQSVSSPRDFARKAHESPFELYQTRDGLTKARPKTGGLTEFQKQALDLRRQEIAQRKSQFGESAAVPEQLYGLQGEDLMTQLPEKDKEIVKGIAEYRLNPKEFLNMRSNDRKKYVELATQYNPNFSMTEFPARAKFLREWTSGKLSNNINSFNTAVEHLDRLDKAIEGTPSFGNQYIEGAMRGYNEQFAGKGKAALAIQRENTAFNAVKGEMAKVFKDSGATDQEIASWLSAYNFNKPIEAKKEFIKEGIELMNSRLNALNFGYERAMGEANPKDIISQPAQKIIGRVQGAIQDNGAQKFNTVEEAESANLPKGTEIMIGGRRAVVE